MTTSKPTAKPKATETILIRHLPAVKDAEGETERPVMITGSKGKGILYQPWSPIGHPIGNAGCTVDENYAWLLIKNLYAARDRVGGSLKTTTLPPTGDTSMLSAQERANATLTEILVEVPKGMLDSVCNSFLPLQRKSQANGAER
jgi:hypothetical protein